MARAKKVSDDAAGDPLWTSHLKPAPGELRIVQAFVNTEGGAKAADGVASPRMLAAWLERWRLLPASAELTADERSAAVTRGTTTISDSRRAPGYSTQTLYRLSGSLRMFGTAPVSIIRQFPDVQHKPCTDYPAMSRCSAQALYRLSGNVRMFGTSPAPIIRRTWVFSTGPVPIIPQARMFGTSPVPIIRRARMFGTSPVPIIQRARMFGTSPAFLTILSLAGGAVRADDTDQQRM